MFESFRAGRRSHESSLAQQLHSSAFREFKIAEIKAATKNFSEKELLGKGSFAEVYRGTTSDGITYAFKRLKAPAEEGSQAYILLERELKAFARLSHTHIIRLHGYCLTSKDHVLVYELADGGTLEQALLPSDDNCCRLHLRQRLQLALDVAEALSYLHSQGVIHRDIKPANILLTSTAGAKLADFGLLKLLDPKNEDTITKVAGTIGYMDPESMRTGRVSFASDVYGFGIILLSLLTGRGPAVSSPEDLDLAKQCEEQERSGAAAKVGSIMSAVRRERPGRETRGRNVMALKRWVAIVQKAGRTKDLLDPVLWPILRLEGTGGGASGSDAGIGARGAFRRARQRRNGSTSVDGTVRAEERQRKEVLALKSCIALALQCAAELPKSRPSMGSVAEDLRMMLRSVPTAVDRGNFQTFTLTDVYTQEIDVLTSDRTVPLNSCIPSTVFCGQDPWDGEPCLVEQVQPNTQSWPLSEQETELQLKVAFGFCNPFVLPVLGACSTDRDMFIVHGMPRDSKEGMELLEFMLFGTGGDFLEFSRRKRRLRAAPDAGTSLDSTASSFSIGSAASNGYGGSMRGLLFHGDSQDLSGWGWKGDSAGESAHPLAASSLLTLPSCCSIAISVAQGLQFLHEKGFVHGNVGPGKVLVDASARGYLIGCGRAAKGLAEALVQAREGGEANGKVTALDGTEMGGLDPDDLSSMAVDAPSSPQAPPDGEGSSIAMSRLSPGEVAVDVRKFGELILQLGTGRCAVISEEADLAIFGGQELHGEEDLPLQKWVEDVIDKGKTHLLTHGCGNSMARAPSVKAKEGSSVHNAHKLFPSNSCTSDSRFNQLALESFLNLGLQCMSRDPTLRPSLAEIIARLAAMKSSWESGSHSQGSGSGSGSGKVKARPSLQRQPAKKR